MKDEQLYSIALTRIPGLGLIKKNKKKTKKKKKTTQSEVPLPYSATGKTFANWFPVFLPNR